MASPHSKERPHSLAEEIDKSFLNCGICLERFSDPRALPCLHAFCCGCLEKLSQGAGKNLFCPTCRKRSTIPVEGVKGFAPHFLVTYLTDTVDKHIEPVETEIVMPLNILTQKFCTNHDGELIRYFCDTCKTTICPDCIILDSEHKDHKYIRLKDLAKKQADSLHSLVKLCKDVQEKYQKCIEDTVQVENDLEISVQLAYSALNKIERNYTHHLQLILAGYRQRLRKQEASRSVVIGQIKDDVQETLVKLHSACELASKVAKAGTEFEIFAVYCDLSTTLQQLILSHPFSVDKALGNVKIKGAEEDASIAMALVASAYSHDKDQEETKKALRDRIAKSARTRGHPAVKEFSEKTFLQYILVAVFAILMYRVLCSLMGYC